MESELDYDNGPEESAATIHFTYNGSFVGSASVEIVRTNAAASKTQNSTNAAAGQVYYINIKNVLFAVVAMAIFLFALISLISLLRNYSFGKRRKVSLKRSKRRRKDGIDFDRYTRGPDGL